MTSTWYSHKSTIYRADNLEWVATTNRIIVGLPENQEYEEDTAALIAAAPNLLECLKTAVKLYDDNEIAVCMASSEWVDQARLLIKRLKNHV